MAQEILIANEAKNTQKCGICGKRKIVTDEESGELVCRTCGYVLIERVEDSGPEHRNFLDGEDRSRTGSATLLSRHDRGLATVINPINTDATGKRLHSTMMHTMGRLRLWDARSQAQKSSDRNLRKAFDELGRLRDKLGLSEAIIEKTAYIYRKAINKKIVKGRSISALLVASLYAACRETNTPRTLKHIQKASNVQRKQITKCYRKLVEVLDLKFPPINTVQCILPIANKLGISEKTKRYAIQLLQECQKKVDLSGKNPIGLAAAVIYLACVKMGENFTQRKIAKAANITEVTIRIRGAEIKKALNLSNTLEVTSEKGIQT